jgi:transposase
MDLAQYAVTAVLVEGRSVRAVAASTGRSKSWVQRHVALYREGGEGALLARKRGPASALNRTGSDVEDVIVAMRKELVEQGYDAGARTLRYHLVALGGDTPSLSTIHRVLVRRGFVTPQPQKRPRQTWTRFESDLPRDLAERHDPLEVGGRGRGGDHQLRRRLLTRRAVLKGREGGDLRGRGAALLFDR